MTSRCLVSSSPPGSSRPARTAPAAEDRGRALGRYDRFTEALQDDGPGGALQAASVLLRHIAALLSGDDGPGRYLPDGSPVATMIARPTGQLDGLAADLAALAPLADDEETGDDEEPGRRAE